MSARTPKHNVFQATVTGRKSGRGRNAYVANKYFTVVAATMAEAAEKLKKAGHSVVSLTVTNTEVIY